MVDVTDIFGGPFSISRPHIDSPEIQIAVAMRRAGIEPPHDLKIDGQLHRFSTKGRKRDDSGWYIIFPDEPVAGRFGCWRDQIDCVFRAEIGRELTPAENMAILRRQAEAKARRDEERQKKADIAAETVEAIWSAATAATQDQPYLKRKGIKPHGSRVTGDGRLIVPLYDQNGDLASLQYISDDEKRYHPGGVTKGCSWQLGEISPGPIFLAEGFATAATIHEVSGRPVYIAYSANNLPAVAGQMREKHGLSQDIIIVADNDASNVGRNKADEAAAKHGARIVMPPTAGDANDYYQAGGDLAALLFPPADDWLVPADDFSEQPAPIKWLIKHWLQADAMVMVHGPSGGGKTFVVLDMVLAISSRGAIAEWFGHRVKPGSVVYLAGEGHHGLRGRVAAWKQARGVTSLDMWLSRHGLDLNTPQGYQKTADAIRALPNRPAVIVVDTLHRFLAGDENSAQDAKTMLDACSALMQEFSASVILVHHTGVSVEAQHRARGSSAWKGALDIEISIVPGETIEILQRKSKDAEEAAPIWVELQSTPIAGWLDEDGEQVTSAVLMAGTEPQKNKGNKKLAASRQLFERAWWASGAELLDDAPYISNSALIECLIEQGYSEKTARNYVKQSNHAGPIVELMQAGIIEPRPHGWAVIDASTAAALMTNRDGEMGE